LAEPLVFSFCEIHPEGMEEAFDWFGSLYALSLMPFTADHRRCTVSAVIADKPKLLSSRKATTNLSQG
jgi:hypothetical protein